MSLMRKVVELVCKRGQATAEDIIPECPEFTRGQILQAMQNARHRGWLVILERRHAPNFGGGRLPWVYGPGEPIPAKPVFKGKRPVASVWELWSMA
jgi:hypothetical protein